MVRPTGNVMTIPSIVVNQCVARPIRGRWGYRPVACIIVNLGTARSAKCSAFGSVPTRPRIGPVIVTDHKSRSKLPVTAATGRHHSVSNDRVVFEEEEVLCPKIWIVRPGFIAARASVSVSSVGDKKTLRIALSMHYIVVCDSHTPAPNANMPGINVIEKAMIYTHLVIRGSAGAG